MTVRRRLILSNIMMIIVPVIAAALTGLLCVGIIWLSIISGAGLDMEDTEDFDRSCRAMTETIDYRLRTGRDLSSLEALFDSNKMTVRVQSKGDEVYAYGSSGGKDTALIRAAEQLESGAVVTQNGRSLYKTVTEAHGKTCSIYLLSSNHSDHGYERLKTAIAVSGGVLLLAILAAVFLTNRFLTGFVFRRIEEPLDILTNGVHEIRDGNLDYRINYKHKDEFKPVCEDFNEMAVRLKESVMRQQMQEQSRKELLVGISHDIRSPLTSIKAYVEGLLEGVARTPETQHSYLTTIKTKAEELDHMVSQLFLFSKMELGEYADNACLLRLDEKVEALVFEAKTEFEENGLHIETALVPASVTIDPIQLDRVIGNIMSNSLKYKEKETGMLRIELTKTEKSCRLTFDDDGPGVPAPALPHLFEVFYRSDPARQNPQKGSGLGLAIAKSIIDHAGGRIRAEQSELGGLRIVIDLPCETEREANGEDTDCGR